MFSCASLPEELIRESRRLSRRLVGVPRFAAMVFRTDFAWLVSCASWSYSALALFFTSVFLRLGDSDADSTRCVTIMEGLLRLEPSAWIA